MTSHSDVLELWRKQVDAKLETCLRSQPESRLRDAMAYSLLAPGKRVRPLLAMAACDALGGEAVHALPAACALEMIHAYSLIHDDLPAMDDDALRRGRPTCHIQYDEATAILAGDALQTLAFETLAEAPVRPLDVVRLLRILARASGASGMAVGQAWDMEATDQAVDLDTLQRIHRHKTGALIQASLEMGGIIAGADETSMARLGQLGKHLGLAFQIQDDILDETADTATLGKAAGQDRAHNKSTYVRLLGLSGAEHKAQDELTGAAHCLKQLAADDRPLACLVDQLARRAR
ncbi:MAG: polyprenyl synthetase family protein [Gammaproteobacteria bacterium]|nr:MAG: polyprenyl synthetase family protein [Gammaproteobacteria bacterium]